MKIILPADSPNPNLSSESGTITLIPSGNDHLYFYEGTDLERMQATSIYAVREIIRKKRLRTDPSKLMLVLKPARDCSYKNTIALLDEMVINKIARYALVDLSVQEIEACSKINTQMQ